MNLIIQHDLRRYSETTRCSYSVVFNCGIKPSGPIFGSCFRRIAKSQASWLLGRYLPSSSKDHAGDDISRPWIAMWASHSPLPIRGQSPMGEVGEGLPRRERGLTELWAKTAYKRAGRTFREEDIWLHNWKNRQGWEMNAAQNAGPARWAVQCAWAAVTRCCFRANRPKPSAKVKVTKWPERRQILLTDTKPSANK